MSDHYMDLPPDTASMLQEVEQNLLSQAFSRLDSVNEICRHVLTGGKRIRPRLLLLAGCALQADRAQCISLATAVELIHAASLVHDDVIDGATERRHQPSVNHRWGMRRGILIGDLLYACAFNLISRHQPSALRYNLAQAAYMLAESEFLQLDQKEIVSPDGAKCQDQGSDEDLYFRIIDGKTASMFRFCTQAPALQCAASEHIVKALTEFGTCFGRAFQLTDDALDCDLEAADTGKSRGADLRDGNRTLTIAWALQQTDAQGRKSIEEALSAPQHVDPSVQALQAIAATDAVRYTRQCAEEYAVKAVSALQVLPENPYRQKLQDMARALTERQR